MIVCCSLEYKTRSKISPEPPFTRKFRRKLESKVQSSVRQFARNSLCPTYKGDVCWANESPKGPLSRCRLSKVVFEGQTGLPIPTFGTQKGTPCALLVDSTLEVVDTLLWAARVFYGQWAVCGQSRPFVAFLAEKVLPGTCCGK